MDFTKVANIVVQQIKDEPAVEGVFLFGSIAAKKNDDYSDIDIGIVSRDTVKDYRKAYGLSGDIFNAIGKRIAVLEQDEERTHMASALYGKTEYPPLGLKVDLLFSQLKNLADKMLQASDFIVFDRNAGLASLLEKHAKSKSKDDFAAKLKENLNEYPFYVYEAVRAFGRKDHARVQSAAEQMRKAIYHVAAVRAGHSGHGGAYGLVNLAPGEKWVVEHSYQTCTRKTVQKLTELYIACLADIKSAYHIEAEVSAFQQSLSDLL
jgi:predicted nucleotidyltransferase